MYPWETIRRVVLSEQRRHSVMLAFICTTHKTGMISQKHFDLHQSFTRGSSSVYVPSRVVPGHTILRPGTTNFGGRWLRIPTYPSVSFQVIQAISCPFSLTWCHSEYLGYYCPLWSISLDRPTPVHRDSRHKINYTGITRQYIAQIFLVKIMLFLCIRVVFLIHHRCSCCFMNASPWHDC